MKKIIGLLLISSLLINSLFAGEKPKNKVKVIPIKTPYNTISTDADGKSTQTVISDSGMEITVDAEIDEEKDLTYNLKITNLRNKDFKLKQDCVKTYYGNFDKDEWTENDSTVYKLPKNATTTTTKTDSNKDSEMAAAACIGVGVACLCGLAIIDFFSSSSKSTPTTKNSKTRRVEPRGSGSSSPRYDSRYRSSPRGSTNFIWIFVDDDNTDSRSNTSNYDSRTNRDVVVTPVVPETVPEEHTLDTYKGSFVVPCGDAPDYKLRFIVSENEYIDFYFSRSDRDDFVNPFKDRSYGRHSLMVSADTDFEKWGGYYIYSGAPIGFYLGANLKFNELPSAIGQTNGSDYSNLYLGYDAPYPTGYDYTKLYQYSLFNIEQQTNPSLGFDLGITIKTIPHTWLMLGCGFEIVDEYSYGTIKYKEVGQPDSAYQTLTTGWIEREDVEFKILPEIGVNIIFDHLDIGALCQYSLEDQNVNFRIMAGIAF